MKKSSFPKLWLLPLTLHFCSYLVAQNPKFDFSQFEKRNGKEQITALSINEQIAAADVKYLPTVATNFTWDTLNKVYNISNQEAMKYNSVGKIISKTSYYPSAVDSSSKTLYQYYPKDGGMEELYLDWEFGGWANSSKSVLLKDSYGNETEDTQYSWQNTTKEWIIRWSNKNSYKYDGQGRMIEEVSTRYNDGIYTNESKIVYTYLNINDKGMNTLTFYNWENNAWVVNRRLIDIVWKDYKNIEYISLLQQKFTNNEWVNDKKMARAYTGNNYTEIAQSYTNGKWINNYKINYSIDKDGNNTTIAQLYDVDGILTNDSKQLKFVDSKGNDAGFSSYLWENNVWILDISNLYTNSYNTNGALIEVIREDISPSYSGKSKTTYSDFVAVTTGVSEGNVADILSIYPIPAKDFITISPIGNQSLTFKILNGQGIEIPTDFSTSKIVVSQWAAGIYYLQIRSAEGTYYTKKLVKE